MFGKKCGGWLRCVSDTAWFQLKFFGFFLEFSVSGGSICPPLQMRGKPQLQLCPEE